MSTRVPPHNLEAERSVLDAILICGALALEPIAVEERLRPDDFYREGHALIYRAMLALHGRREPIDTLTVSGQLGEDGGLEQAGGAAAVEELVGWVPAAGNARAYARIVREHAVRRRLLHVCYELQDRALDGQGEVDVLLADAGRRVGELLDQARASAGAADARAAV
jgi:replicative DNA helicase